MLNDIFIDSKKEDYSLENIFNNKDLSINEFHVLGLLFELSNNTFIREKSIHEKIALFISSSFKSISVNTNINTNKTFLGDRENLLDIITGKKVNDVFLLTLNALRAYMKNSEVKSKDIENPSFGYKINSTEHFQAGSQSPSSPLSFLTPHAGVSFDSNMSNSTQEVEGTSSAPLERKILCLNLD